MGEHWYNTFGEPCYDTGLREARKRGLLPSITTIDYIIANPGLEIWKQRQVLEASLTLTRKDNETDKEFIDRILFDSKQQGRKAAKLGTVVHHMAERYIKGKPLFFKGNRPDVWDIFKPLRDWIDTNLMVPDFGFMHNEGAEVILVNEELGYAGKADFVGRLLTGKNVILDFKTTFIKLIDIKKDGTLKKAKLYPSWCRQLIALDMCTNGVNELLSVVISTNPYFLGIWIHKWNDKEIGDAWIQFTAALNIYRSIKNL